jgi:hypothetical protein
MRAVGAENALARKRIDRALRRVKYAPEQPRAERAVSPIKSA